MLLITIFHNVWLLVATEHVGMTRKQDGGYTQWTQFQRDYLHWVKISFTHQWLELCVDDEHLHISLQECQDLWHLRGSFDENACFHLLSHTFRLI